MTMILELLVVVGYLEYRVFLLFSLVYSFLWHLRVQVNDAIHGLGLSVYGTCKRKVNSS
jgi:hypothetical protein